MFSSFNLTLKLLYSLYDPLENISFTILCFLCYRYANTTLFTAVTKAYFLNFFPQIVERPERFNREQEIRSSCGEGL